MDGYINISNLNDFIFCPYSIYLHNVYEGSMEDLIHATPQTQGKMSHNTIDDKRYSTRKDLLVGISVYSDELNLMGKIDIYKESDKLLIERKYNLNHIYTGQYYQLWSQYFCMLEMGYIIDKLAFYISSSNKLIPVDLPSNRDKQELINFIKNFKNYNPEQPIKTNINKCTHCIYCNLCDKINIENVY